MEPGDPISRLSDGVFCPPIDRLGFYANPYAVLAGPPRQKREADSLD
jgi:hypothetical protein